MIHETDIREAFACLLGRAPEAAEAAELAARVSAAGGDERAELHKALIRSEDFRARRVSAYCWKPFAPLELDRPRLVFIHIPKCGGTTITAMLERLFEPGRICPERLEGLGNWTVNELAAYDLFSGHFDLPVCRSIPGEVRAFTMLREPKARLVSLFRFWSAHRPDPERDRHPLMELSRALDAETFFAHPEVVSHPQIRDAIAGQLINTGPNVPLGPSHPLVADPANAFLRAWDALRRMDAFGLLERFEDSRALINATLGLSMLPTPPRQVLTELVKAHPHMRRTPGVAMTARLDALLDDLTRIDRRLYGRAARLFEQRVLLQRGSVARLARAGR